MAYLLLLPVACVSLSGDAFSVPVFFWLYRGCRRPTSYSAISRISGVCAKSNRSQSVAPQPEFGLSGPVHVLRVGASSDEIPLGFYSAGKELPLATWCQPQSGRIAG